LDYSEASFLILSKLKSRENLKSNLSTYPS
jgi:hypothetical protein